MTRRASILAYVLVLALGLLGLQSWGIAVSRVEKHVIAAIETRTGLVVTALERAEIALLPWPRISLSQVAFSQRDGALSGQALRLRAQARLLPLLAGRIDFDRIDLVGPQLDVVVPAQSDGLADWLAVPLEAIERLRGQSRIVITAGSVFLRAQGAIQTILREVNLVIDERGAQDPLAVAGTLSWRGVPTEVKLIWPVATARGRTMLSIAAPPLKLQFDGARSSAPEPITTGKMTLTARSLRDLLGWFGEAPRLASAVGAVDLTADIRIRPHDTVLTNVAVRVDGDRLDGALNLTSVAGRTALSGTLAGATLDLGRLVQRLDLPPADAAPDAAALPFEAWTAQDIDLRVSVEAARLEGARLTDVATYLLVKKGRFEAGILRAGAYGGSAKARLLATATPGGIDVKLVGGIEKVNLGRAGADLPPLARLSGTGALQFSLDGLGRSLPAILGSLSGRGTVAVRQGELAGFSFGELLRRAERNPSLAVRDWRQGKTAFEAAAANLTVADGVLTLSEAQMAGAGYRLTLVGSAALTDGSLDMAALLQPVTGPLRLPFRLNGTLAAPAFELQAEALLRPTGAAIGEPLPLR
jgi:uncharacterized protein involved in outer membrane biogenesis